MKASTHSGPTEGNEENEERKMILQKCFELEESR